MAAIQAIGVVVGKDHNNSQNRDEFDLAIYSPHRLDQPAATIRLTTGRFSGPALGDRFTITFERDRL